ncbi:hypothetical protein [Corynebacterium lowii]|uniref:ABC-2 family transporter protein n=1 Tax=Corynebacterium lowii TaxID=1544413 RepID=A0A0Q0UE84_9CORY|nr:hypothetical protein [Corynebacterium lowii]KQB86153.1 ABC-2 family transporter protein [Corynebacterium lowii]MDP9852628.1 ABC-2 type transport system permease protein [Corynebacterium lowii]
METMLNACRAEYLKLRTTASLWWTSGIFLLLALSVPTLLGLTISPAETDAEYLTSVANPEMMLGTIPFICLPVVVVQAAMTVSTEYRYGIQATTLLATPRRGVVAAAKWLVYSAHVAVLTLIAVFLTYVIFGALTTGISPSTFLSDGHALSYLLVMPLGMILIVTFTQGIAMLVRNTAGAVVLVLAWKLVIESALEFLPKIGHVVADYLPFKHFDLFIAQSELSEWGMWGDGAYFTLWAVVVWAVGFASFARRDA